MKYVVDFHNHLTDETIQNYINSIQGSIVKVYSTFEKTYIIESDSDLLKDPDLHAHILADDSSVLELLSTTIISDQQWGTRRLDDQILTISTVDPNDWWKNYIIANPEFDQPTYSIDRRGLGYVVYVVDSGCQLSHPEFVNRPVQNLFSFNNDFTDKNGHGTAIASVITGSVCGITDATVKSVKIFEDGTPTKQSDLLNALDAIAKDFYDNNLEFAIVNCSWTISKNEFVEQKLRVLANMGMVIVAAAGNSGIPIENVTPASMEEAVTIGSFNSNLEPSNFSNYTGSNISLTNNETNLGALDGWAPGEGIYCATINGNYGLVAGTSIAAGIHSAVCAYNLSEFPLEYKLNMSLTTFMNKSSLRRPNLLNLDNIKYQNSKNLISTIIDKIDMNPDTVVNMSMLSKGVSGGYYYLGVFNPRISIKLEIFGDLPMNTSINSAGIFKGIVPEVDVVTINHIPMTLTRTDNEEIPFEFEIITIPKSFIIGVDTTGDPVLDLKLQGANCSNNPCEEAPDWCSDDCGFLGPGLFCQFVEDKSCPLVLGTRSRCSCNPI